MINTTLAHYRITSKLGQGGMGEVYRATDTKLDRQVAIKVLPESFARDQERLARFEREARALASLDHPNIGSIYGIEESNGKRCLILQLVEGEDLSERLKRGPLPFDESVEVCKQIAAALEAAHEKGIIHRDLKPGNIKLTADGKVKVLDFGLAKAPVADSSVAGVENSQSPTLTADFTRPGVILGTAAYMSPEQARGKAVDKRSDIWSFGCVLFECLAGRRIFRGEDVTETLAMVIKGDPDWTALPENTPATIRLLLRKCLTKDCKRRLRDIGDAIVDLEQASEDSPSDRVIQQPDKTVRSFMRMILVAGVAAFVTGLAVWVFKPPARPVNDRSPKYSDLIIDEELMGGGGNPNLFALSRDGSKVAYSKWETFEAQESSFQIRNLRTGQITPLSVPGTLASHPFFSWNGSEIGFLLNTRELWRIDLSTRTPKRIDDVDLNYSTFLGAAWGKNGEIVFAEAGYPLRMIPATGGAPVDITTPNPGEDHASPEFLPDGDRILFVSLGQGSSARDSSRAEVLSLRTRDRQSLALNGSAFVRYAASGHLIYGVDNELWAVPFDEKTLEVTGKSRRVLTSVATAGRSFNSARGRSQFEIAEDGTLIFLSQEKDPETDPTSTLVWVDAELHKERFTELSGRWSGFSLSPDEKRVVLVSPGGDISILENRKDGNDKVQILVNEKDLQGVPLWDVDGESIFYSAIRQGTNAVWKRRVDFSNRPPELVCRTPAATLRPTGVSSKYLLMSRAPVRDNSDIAILDRHDMNAEPQLLMKESYNEGWASLSPDEQWLVYYKNEHGPNVYLAPLSRPTGGEELSSWMSHWPIWSKSGNRIFFQSRNSIYSVTLGREGDRLFGTPPERRLSVPWLSRTGQWTVSQDEKRFLLLVNVNTLAQTNAPVSRPDRLTMITDFFAELTKDETDRKPQFE